MREALLLFAVESRAAGARALLIAQLRDVHKLYKNTPYEVG
jgi:hypothetical protein